MSFIFQAIPERYKLAERLREGRRVNWVASRYREQMKSGELVYFWQAGSESSRGLYGWGVITREPQPDEGSGYRVEVRYEKRFKSAGREDFISSRELVKDPRLEQHLIFRMPIGTNFILTADEDLAIRDSIRKHFGADFVPPVS